MYIYKLYIFFKHLLIFTIQIKFWTLTLVISVKCVEIRVGVGG